MPYSTGHLDDEGRLAITEEERTWTQPILGRLGTSFGKVWSCNDARPVSNLILTIQHMCDFTIIVENYAEGRPPARMSTAINDQRNFTHHALMSLCSSREFEIATGNLCDDLYEPCRLASAVYSILVIFPMPPTLTLYKKVAAELRQSLIGQVAMETLGAARLELLVWTLTMGALVSIGLPERAWFMTQMTRALDRLEIRALSGFKALLQGFLWHPKTNDTDGMELWRDIKFAQRHAGSVYNTVPTAERFA